MKVEYANPFIAAAIHTFDVMLHLKLQTEKAQVKTLPYPTYDISGVIGLSGDAVGSIVLSYPKIVALKVVSKFIGMEIKIIGPDVSDAIGELTNIIAGNAKKDLSGLNVSISLPNVIIGRNHRIDHASDIPTITVPFSSEYGSIALEVCLKTK